MRKRRRDTKLWYPYRKLLRACSTPSQCVQGLLSCLQGFETKRNILSDFIYSWQPPRHIREASERENDAIRKKYHIIVEGNNPVPPINNFRVSDYTRGFLERALLV